MTSAGPFPETLTKTMSAAPDEFHRSMAVLEANRAPALTHTLPCGSGSVTITYEALPAVTLGTLLPLPRARVTLSFADTTASSRAAFLQRFDLAFQRGGG